MPLQFEWQPATQPVPRGQQVGLLVYGDDPSVAASTDGRVRLIEVAGGGASGGPAETPTERLVAVFHGKFHRDPAAKVSDRITFEILRAPTDPPHEGSVFGFDPECMFGIDFFLLTFVNRQFLVWFPFHTDVRAEGDFLELQAVAEVATGGQPPFREIGRSMIRTLVNRETTPRTVETTSTNTLNNQPIQYTGKVVGVNIAVQEDYLLAGGTRNAAQSTANQIVLDPALVPAPRTGAGAVQFAPYSSGALQIVLMANLLEELLPDQAFAKNQFPAQNPTVIIGEARTRIRATVPPRLVEIFEDAGFVGVTARWQDEQAAAPRVAEYTARFIDRGARGGGWQLRDTNNPLETNFWNFFIAHSAALPVAARSEEIVSRMNQRTVNKAQVFLRDNLPVGSGTKRISQPVRISSQVFLNTVTTDPATNSFRQYPDITAFRAAVDVMARKVAATAAHEIAHSLGMMHTVRTAAQGVLLERSGAPVLTVTSEDLRSHIGPTVRFSMQTKVIWGTVFGVTPAFNDATLVNKSWKPNEIPTLTWAQRRTKFLSTNGETRPLTLPPGLVQTGVPPFAVAPPGKPQRGTR